LNEKVLVEFWMLFGERLSRLL